MPRTQPAQPYYAIYNKGRFFDTFTPRVLDVFSTRALAITSAGKITLVYVRTYSDALNIKYVGDNSDIKIVTQHSDIVGTSTTSAQTVFVAVDASGSDIAETAISGTADDAWTACEVMKRKRGHDWKDEKAWTDKMGCRHGVAKFKVSQQLAGLGTMGILRHHWYVKEFVVDKGVE